jgi:hypothetical protein
MKSQKLSVIKEQTLKTDFKNPPDNCRLFVRWWWFGPAVTKDELSREMELMKSAGVGGFEIQPTYPLSLNDPEKGIVNLRYLSSEFLAAVNFAVNKSQELGLTADVTGGSGWPYGGPHIPIQLSAAQIKCVANQVKAQDGFCDPPKLEIPAIRVDEKLIHILAVRKVKGELSETGAVDLTKKVNRDRTIELNLAKGDWEVLFFIESRTLQEVKRPALGAEGYVVDHYNHRSLEKHLETVGEPLILAGANKIRAIFCDSLEVYNSDWTPDLLSKFKKRRGYDLKPLLPALWNKFGEKTEQVRIDYGKTLSEMAIDEFIKPMHEWCRSHGVLFRIQQYGIPAIELTGYSHADLPEGEGRDWRLLSPSRWASSAAHVYGKPVCSAECFTFLSNDRIITRPGVFPGFRFTTSLQNHKAAADIYFLEGINHLIAHGWGYSPPAVGTPGWTFYASCLVNHNNTWFKHFPLLTAYIHRVSYLLRQGNPVIDAAIYLPVYDTWAKSTDPSALKIPGNIDLNPKLMDQLLSNGYNFDFINDDALVNHARVENGRLLVNGMNYPIIILPEVTFMPPETMEKIRDFYKSGGIVIAAKCLPDQACGLKNIKENTTNLQQAVREVFGEKARGKGKAYLIKNYEKEFSKALRDNISPDIDWSGPDADLGFVHRQVEDSDLYFVVNTSSQPKNIQAAFRVGQKTPEVWDPLTGEIHPVNVYSWSAEGTRLPITLKPFGSMVVRFKQPREKPRIVDTDLPEIIDFVDLKEGNLLKAIADQNAGYFIQGKKEKINVTVKGVPTPIPLQETWHVTFDGHENEQLQMRKLKSWTEYTKYRYFSGSATYTTDLQIPQEYINNDIMLRLDLGDVREIAEVYVNDVKAGVSWKSPYMLEVTKYMRPGSNTLKIIVTNALFNKVIGMDEPDYPALARAYGQRFPLPLEYKKSNPPLPSGLLGPVQITAARIITIRAPD